MGEKSARNPHKSSRAKKISRVLQRIHRHAENLHGALRLAWVCGCGKSYETALQLDSRKCILGRKPVQSPDMITFSLFFSSCAATPCWQAAEIITLDEPADCGNEPNLAIER
jgi:hypothetical protein